MKLKRYVNVQLKKLAFVIRYVPGQYKIEQMCNKAIIENDGTLKYISDWYKTQEICDKAVDNYAHLLEFVPDCYKTRKMFNKALNTFLLQSILFLNAIRCLIKCGKNVW